MLVEKNILSSIDLRSFITNYRKSSCSFSNGRVIGLSKMNRIVEYYLKDRRLQERLTMQIVQELQNALGIKDVACVIDANISV
jgi:GTP cyclohydrolase I